LTIAPLEGYLMDEYIQRFADRSVRRLPRPFGVREPDFRPSGTARKGSGSPGAEMKLYLPWGDTPPTRTRGPQACSPPSALHPRWKFAAMKFSLPVLALCVMSGLLGHRSTPAPRRRYTGGGSISISGSAGRSLKRPRSLCRRRAWVPRPDRWRTCIGDSERG